MPKSVHPNGDFEELLLQSLYLGSDSYSNRSIFDGQESCPSSPESIYPSDEEILFSYSRSDPLSLSGRTNDDPGNKRQQYHVKSSPECKEVEGRITEGALAKHSLAWDSRDHNLGCDFNCTADIFEQRRAITPSLRRKSQPIQDWQFHANIVSDLYSPRRSDSMDTNHELSRASHDTNPVQRVRNFSMSSKGIINRGDSLRLSASSTQRCLSIDDGCSSTSSCSSSSSSERSTQASSSPESAFMTSQISRQHKILVLGTSSVGKTSLVRQFMTSEYMGHVDSDQDQAPESNVAVSLNSEETYLNFVKISPDKDILWHEDASAYLVLYSVSDVTSYKNASRLLADIRELLPRNTVIILVANKADIVRNRNITKSDGRKMAEKYQCKYIEISTVLNHKVDDLLVGLVSQIKLLQEKIKRKGYKQPTDPDHSEFSLVHKVHKATQGLSRVLRKNPWCSRSCDNLLVL